MRPPAGLRIRRGGLVASVKAPLTMPRSRRSCRHGVEHSLGGVVSKRRASIYISGRGRHWVKSKMPTWLQANKDR